MSSKKCSDPVRSVVAAAAVGMTLLAACSNGRPPAQFAEGVGWVAARHQVRDAKSQLVEGYASLRMDAALLDRLDAALQEEQLPAAQREAASVLDDAHALAVSSAENELARLDDAGWQELSKRYWNLDAPPDEEGRRLLAGEFQRQTGLQLHFLKQRVRAAADVGALRAALAPIREATQASAKHAGRAARAAPLALFALPAALAREAIHNDEATCQGDCEFASSVEYAPDPASPDAGASRWDLLARHAPVFVQEESLGAKYAPSVDQLGRVTAADDGTIGVDTSRPSVYAYARTVLLKGKPHVQLTYAIWYPEHPKLRSGVDPEAGKIDGATVRITLDAEGRPATFETLNNCGCHHRLYPTVELERAARSAFGGPIQGKSFALEQDVKGKYDLIIPKAIDPAAGPRPVVRCRAGTHAVVDVDYAAAAHAGEPVRERRAYVLRSYDELERLKTPSGRVVSMFLPNGLVRGADRLEGTLFKPLGMLNAGQPRQRGTQLIQWDQYDFDDPRLMEKTLRLPGSF